MAANLSGTPCIAHCVQLLKAISWPNVDGFCFNMGHLKADGPAVPSFSIEPRFFAFQFRVEPSLIRNARQRLRRKGKSRPERRWDYFWRILRIQECSLEGAGRVKASISLRRSLVAMSEYLFLSLSPFLRSFLDSSRGIT